MNCKIIETLIRKYEDKAGKTRRRLVRRRPRRFQPAVPNAFLIFLCLQWYRTSEASVASAARTVSNPEVVKYQINEIAVSINNYVKTQGKEAKEVKIP